MAVAKPKVNRKGVEKEPAGYDQCLTPPYALEPLYQYLKPFINIGEPAAGEGHLVTALFDHGHNVWANDLSWESGVDFFDINVFGFDAQVTNPPYSIKFQWMQHSYELGRPFALLLPVEVIGADKAQQMMKKYGCELMLLDSRVDFCMPNKGWKGSAAQFPVLWFCHHILPEPIMYGSIKEAKKQWKQKLLRDEIQ